MIMFPLVKLLPSHNFFISEQLIEKKMVAWHAILVIVKKSND